MCTFGTEFIQADAVTREHMHRPKAKRLGKRAKFVLPSG
ncbi:hypothetical protein P775_13610 [Puniceibacterium antarcticum]|uniref:Uncharacterized protein n=1 Tax=Puniceibacterium antarcticum TaxID=1206336 RepID=A0A2G8RD99_9RHOB|nr:hypothetical protein P775_13610 [Puniceibacterium antarcticum]